MGEPPDYPEWAGYLAAFDAYVDARKRGDEESARQARRIMGWFAAELLPGRKGKPTEPPGRHGRTLRSLLELLELDPE